MLGWMSNKGARDLELIYWKIYHVNLSTHNLLENLGLLVLCSRFKDDFVAMRYVDGSPGDVSEVPVT